MSTGYEISDQDRETVNPKVLCSKCKNIVRNALQTSCGHRYCSECLESEFIGLPVDRPTPYIPAEQSGWRLCICSKGLAICNVCEEPLTRDKVFRDRFADREVQSLVLRCTFCVFGCRWKGELRHREEHEKLCPSNPEVCKFRKQEYPRSELANHLDPNSVDVCEALTAPCPFVAAGCNEKKPMNIEERQAHLQKNNDKHLNLLLSKVLSLSAYLGDLLPAAQHRTKNGKRMPELTLMHDEIISEMASVKKELEFRILQVEERISGIGFASMSASGYGETAIQDLARRIDNSDAKSASHEILLNEAHSTIEGLRTQLARANQKEGKTEEIIRKLEKRLADQEQIAGLRNLAIADLEEKLKDNIGCSYDGILFKITQVARKRADAVSGRQISFYSPAFYTDPHGYKMCARIYLNGDGMGKGTHISLFFVIMRGEYDALLQWPFGQEVTMMLLDQDDEKHVIDAFRPDPNSSSFQKPRGEMNVPSGYPTFCPHSELERHAYIRDDTMFIGVIVETPQAQLARFRRYHKL